MNNQELLIKVIERAKVWLSDSYDKQTREAVQNLLDNNENELIESFYQNLEFGTGGFGVLW